MTSAAAAGRFLSTPSARRATLVQGFQHPHLPISIHALREEGDLLKTAGLDDLTISIHALREEGDKAAAAIDASTAEFLSTPSARRATR